MQRELAPRSLVHEQEERLHAELARLQKELALRRKLEGAQLANGGQTSAEGKDSAGGEVESAIAEAERAFVGTPESGYNAFAFAVWEVLSAHSAACVAKAWCILIVLLLVQLVLAFGFMDAGTLNANSGGDPAFQPMLDLSIFYASKRIESASVPYVNLVTAVAANILLSSYMREDNVGSLQCFVRTIHHHNPAGPTGEVVRFWVLRQFPLQCAWTVRTLMLPAYAGIGSAISFAAADAADDIVLNSVAMSFVFELDESFYHWNVSLPDRTDYEQAYDAEPLPAATDSGASTIISLYAWLMLIVDLTWATLAYYAIAGIPGLGPPYVFVASDGARAADWDGDANPYVFVEAFIISRGVAFAVAQTHLLVRTRWGALRSCTTLREMAPFLLELVLATVIKLSCAVMALVIIHRGIGNLFGWVVPPVGTEFETVVSDCLQETYTFMTKGACKQVHDPAAAKAMGLRSFDQEVRNVTDFSICMWLFGGDCLV